ncbi:MAG: o-succinylbenzoate synthase, partial [Candidatus Dadabacteria bacterium]
YPRTLLAVLEDFVIPLFFKEQPETPGDAFQVLSKIAGNCIARAGLEMAYWDWYAKSKEMPLYRILGGERDEVPVGISVPLKPNTQELLDTISAALDKGYRKIKVKIEPGRDIDIVEKIYAHFGAGIPLMVDANFAYTLDDIDIFRALDHYDLMMIEQPLLRTDLLMHARLQSRIKNSICLDESIEHLDDARVAAELGSCRVINIKPSRVGGITEAIAIHDYVAGHGIKVWCGGMLETGIGRAANMALATLPNFQFPGDISESARYYKKDIVEPEIRLTPEGTLKLSDKPGIGFDIDIDFLEKITLERKVYRADRAC